MVFIQHNIIYLCIAIRMVWRRHRLLSVARTYSYVCVCECVRMYLFECVCTVNITNYYIIIIVIMYIVFEARVVE